MANIKHVAIDFTIAVAAAVTLGRSASLPSQQVEPLEAARSSEIGSVLTATEDGLDTEAGLVTEEELATEDMMPSEAGRTGEGRNVPRPIKGAAGRYCKSPLSGKPQLSTLKS